MKQSRGLIIGVFGMVLGMLLASPALASEWELSPSSEGEAIANVSVHPGVVTLSPNVPFERVRFVVSGPDGIVFDKTYTETPIAWQVGDFDGKPLQDGRYSFELRFDVGPMQGRSTDSGESPQVKRQEAIQRRNVSGSFSVEGGTIDTNYRSSLPSREIAQLRDPMEAPTTKAYDYDFLFVQSKIGIGIDDSAVVPDSALHIQEQTPTGILLEDRVGAYGTDLEGQWRIKATTNLFTVGHDPTPTTSGGERENFVIEEGSKANALYMDSSGAMGLGTSTPFGSLDIVDSDFFSQISLYINGGVDLAGTIEAGVSNLIKIEGESEQDIVNIDNRSPANALNVTSNGDVGDGTTAPDVELDVRGQAQVLAPTGSGRLIFDTADPANDKFSFLLFRNTGVNGAGIIYRQSNADFYAYDYVNGHFIWRYRTGVQDFVIEDPSVNVGIGKNNPTQRLDVNGNIVASGTITPSSDVNAKTDFTKIDAMDVLNGIESLPITAWRFKEEDEGVRHIGPMAQDFKAAFGVGYDERHIATIDSDGVALAGLKALYSLVQELQAENQQLRERLSRLEAR